MYNLACPTNFVLKSSIMWIIIIKPYTFTFMNRWNILVCYWTKEWLQTNDENETKRNNASIQNSLSALKTKVPSQCLKQTSSIQNSLQTYFDSSSVLIDIAKTNIKKLQTTQNKLLKCAEIALGGSSLPSNYTTKLVLRWFLGF